MVYRGVIEDYDDEDELRRRHETFDPQGLRFFAESDFPQPGDPPPADLSPEDAYDPRFQELYYWNGPGLPDPDLDPMTPEEARQTEQQVAHMLGERVYGLIFGRRTALPEETPHWQARLARGEVSVEEARERIRACYYYNADRYRGAVYLAREIGLRLIAVKRLVKHGQWQNWLAWNFRGAPDTARLYMKLARHWSARLEEVLERDPDLTIRAALTTLRRPGLRYAAPDDPELLAYRRKRNQRLIRRSLVQRIVRSLAEEQMETLLASDFRPSRFVHRLEFKAGGGWRLALTAVRPPRKPRKPRKTQRSTPQRQ